MEYSFGDEYKDGPLVLGLHKKNSMYDIVPVCDCVIVSEDYNKIVAYTMEFARSHQLSYYKKCSIQDCFAIWLSASQRQMGACLSIW